MTELLHLNKSAVMFMHDGAYVQAYNLLHSALDQLKTKVDSQKSHQQEEDVHRMTSDEESLLQPIPVRFAAATEAIADNAFSFYSSAFVFSDSAELDATRSSEARLAAVVLYNFGLCFHIHGVSRVASQAYFAKALQMYKTALSILMSLSAGTQGKADKDCLLMLALYNNIGHIYSCDHRCVETQECLDNIQTILATKTEDKGCGDTAMCGLEYLDFHMNVVILHGTRQHSPAA